MRRHSTSGIHSKRRQTPSLRCYTLDAALDQITRFHTSIVKAVQPASSCREKHRAAVLLIQVLSWIVTSNKLIGQDLREYVLGQSAEEEYRQWVDPMSDVLGCCTWAERRRIFKSRRWQWEFDLFVGLVMNCELFGEIFGLLEVAEHREELFVSPRQSDPGWQGSSRSACRGRSRTQERSRRTAACWEGNWKEES